MAGRFTLEFYETNDGDIMPIRVQPETLLATIGAVSNDAVAGPATGNFGSVSVGQGRRTNGVNARLVRLRFDTGAAPADYLDGGTVTIPALQSNFYSEAAVGATATYLGSACTVVGRSPETVK